MAFSIFVVQPNGNLVLSRTEFRRALGASNTEGKPVTHTIMQADGNLIAYGADGLLLGDRH